MSYQQFRDLATELVQLKDKCLRAGLYRTLRELERAEIMIGFEIAQLLDGSPIPESYIEQRFSTNPLRIP